ncbi:hypothetical protein [Neodiprion sertifer nucleopolyhedrovirus]|uniref:RING-type domain-containing protein n=1 Tax=Neodiprion sertifer nucleopolyhedrovirus TaxID=111874 RepID=Q6JKE1_9CBAC|nr:hypothetical protein NeseNPV_gp19 [Neodiprion sertifer nucleopolyhedrovirus]AAQ96396.1 hypothetical protein [Neodiprion sertifer nucleopolyhedrovirus]
MKRCTDTSANTDVVDDETKQQLATLRSAIEEIVNESRRDSIISYDTRNIRKYFGLYASLPLDENALKQRIEYFESAWGEKTVNVCVSFVNWATFNGKPINMSYINEHLIEPLNDCINRRFSILERNMAMQSSIKELIGSVTCDEPHNVWSSIVKLYELSRENETLLDQDEKIANMVLANLEKIRSCDGPEKMQLMHEIMSSIRNKVEPVDFSLVQKMVKKTNPLNPEHKEFLQNAMFPSMLKVDRECIICFEEKLIYEFCYYECGHSVCSECSHKVNPNQCYYQCTNSKLLTVGFKPANHEYVEDSE